MSLFLFVLEFLWFFSGVVFAMLLLAWGCFWAGCVSCRWGGFVVHFSVDWRVLTASLECGPAPCQPGGVSQNAVSYTAAVAVVSRLCN